MKNPPILISILGFFAILAGFAWLFLGLRILGFDWFTVLGDVGKFEQSGIWGWMAIVSGVIWFAVGVGLWSLRPWAWMFGMIVCGLALFEAFLWMLEYPGSGLGLVQSIMPILIIVYLSTRDVKSAFGLGDSASA